MATSGVLTRGAFWVPEAERDHFDRTYKEALAPILARHGLVDDRPDPRPGPAHIVRMLYDLDAPAIVAPTRAALLADDGLLYFSTNRRRFKFEATGSTALTAREITRETLDEDFRRGRTAHRCWEIRKTAEQSLEATTAASAVRTDPA